MTPTGATRSTRMKFRVGMRGRASRFALSAVVVALFVLVPAAQAFAEEASLKLNIAGTGSGEVKDEAEGSAIGLGTPPIACSYDGTSTKGECKNVPGLLNGEAGFYAARLHAVPAAGSEFVGWRVEQGHDAGECLPASFFGPTTCLVYNEEENEEDEWVIAAEFKLAGKSSFKLNLGTSGTGSGTFKCKVDGGAEEACLAEYEEGKTVEVVPHATTGSEFVNWTGDCSGSGACSPSMTAERSVVGVFDVEPAHPAILSVFKGGSGTGTVLSSPTGISCGGEPCEAVFEEGDVITLEAHAATGSVFAGWLGCRHVTPTTCQVKLGSPEVEVTAIFLIEGKEGTNGKEGPEGKAGKEGATGKEGTTGKEGPEGKAGKEGSRGEIGFPGPEGPQGQAGQTGSQGAQGAQGAQGTQGPAGNPGAVGPQGKQGPVGPAAKVVCKVKQQKNGARVRVTCTVTYQGATASASTARMRWSLTHNGHTARRGAIAHGRLALGYLHNGHYRLHIQGQQGSRLIVVG